MNGSRNASLKSNAACKLITEYHKYVWSPQERHDLRHHDFSSACKNSIGTRRTPPSEKVTQNLPHPSVSCIIHVPCMGRNADSAIGVYVAVGYCGRVLDENLEKK